MNDDSIIQKLQAEFRNNEASTVVVFIIAAISKLDTSIFPMNILRNYARFGVDSKWMYAIDADEGPNSACKLQESWLKDGIEINKKWGRFGGPCGYNAWITASLELTEPFRRNATIKERLRDFTKRPAHGNHISKELAVEWIEDFHLQTFNMDVWNSYGPQRTYTVWKTATEPFAVSWTWLAEPYTITEVPTPWCPIPFYNAAGGADKVVCSIMMYAAGYKLFVLPMSFSIDDLFLDTDKVKTTKDGRRTKNFCFSPKGHHGESKYTYCRNRRDYLLNVLEKNMGVRRMSKPAHSRAVEIKTHNDIIERSTYEVDLLPLERKYLPNRRNTP